MSSEVFREGSCEAKTYKIAISNQKGGVAKTTTVLSLGASLAERGLSVMVVDLDPQGHLTQSLGVRLNGLRHTIGDVLLHQATLLGVSQESAVENLDLVPADRGLILVEKMLNNSTGFEYRLQRSLAELSGRYYDLILFDCPPSFGPLTINALTASDLVIIPVLCDYFSAQSLHIFLRLIDTVRKNSNPNIEPRLLVTLYDQRLRLSKMVYDQFQRKYGRKLFDSVIPVDSKLRESPIFGRPITHYATRGRGAQQYRSLARELLECLMATN